MKKTLQSSIAAAIVLSLGVASPVMAFEPGDWLVKVGATLVDPTSDNHEIVSVDSATSMSINFTYMMTDIWALELLAAYPFKHDLELVDGTDIGSTKHLPPTFTLQYRPMPTSKFQPYVGLGINYTDFFSEKTAGPLTGLDLSLDSSWGLAGQVGFDYVINDKIFLNLDLRYIDIESDAKLGGESLGTVEIDPYVYGAHIGFRF